MKIYRVIQTKFDQLVEDNVHMIINLPTKVYLSDIRVTNISKNLTYKMAAETNLHRYGTKLRHCHPMLMQYTSKYSVQNDPSNCMDNLYMYVYLALVVADLVADFLEHKAKV